QAWDEDNEADNMFYEQLLDPSILKPRSEEQKSESDDVKMEPVHTTGMARITSNYDTFHTRATPITTLHEQSVIDAQRKIRAMDLINKTFNTDKYDFTTEPLHSGRPDQFARYKAVDKSDPTNPIVEADLTLPNVDIANNINYLRHKRAPETDGHFMDPNLRMPRESLSPTLTAEEVHFDDKSQQRMSKQYQSALDKLFIESTAKTRDELWQTYEDTMMYDTNPWDPADFDKPRTPAARKRHLWLMEQYCTADMDIDSDTMDDKLTPDHNEFVTTEWSSSADIRPMFQLLVAEKHVTADIHTQLAALLKRYEDQCSQEWAHTGKIPGVTLKLDLYPGSQPFKRAPYPTNFRVQR
ncbi:MAG: hypothetical protein GY942_19645, partial [Aestuariibacter sp.]|nr:hypothetical protein [Aestuariibacter sp.]